MADFRIYRTYRYIDKNPVIDRVRTLLQDEGYFKDLGVVHEISGVAKATLENWFHGDTRNPQHATIAAVITSLGFREEFVRDHQIDIDKERKAAADWLARQGKTNGHRKPKKKARSK